MNSYGLGLVLTFDDKASSGMGQASQTFAQMSGDADSLVSSIGNSATELTAIGYSLNEVGNTLTNVGSSITGIFTGITKQVIDTGTTVQGYQMQLSALYGSAEKGQKKLNEIKQYAMSSVFEVSSLIPAVTMMKAVGIEAMDEVTTSSGKASQKLLDYASDIAAMVPNIRNAYGTGVTAAIGALKEYIAEGNALSLKRGAGLDITGILGEGKGSTMEERATQVADLVEKLNILGYTASLAGTPTQRLSNLQDALFNSLSKIADSGVFEVYCGLLEKLSNWVFSLVNDEETFNTITQVLADTMTSLLSPVQKLIDFGIEYGDILINWIKEHPVLTQNILKTVAAVGAFLVVGGKVLKLLSTLSFAMSGLGTIKSLPSLLSRVGASFGSLILRAMPFVALAGVVYYAWKNNLFGINEAVTNTFKDIKTVFSLISDAWNDNELSVEQYEKANKLGILPLISSLLQLKYYWGYFVSGLKEGFNEFFKGLSDSLSFLKIFGIDVVDIAQKLGNFLQKLVQIGQEDKWKAIGEAVGKFAGLAVSLIAVYKALSLISGISSKVKSLGGLPVIGKFFGGKSTGGGSASPMKSGLDPKSTLKSMLSLSIIIGGFGLLVSAFGLLAKIPGFTEFIASGVNLLVKLFSGIATIALGAGAVILLVGVMDKLKLGPASVAKGIANLAIVIGGFSLIITAVGAIMKIPGFSDFLKTGVSTLNSLFSALSIFSSPNFWVALATITALGLISPATIALGIAGLAIAVAGFTAIISAFGALQKIPGFEDFITSGGEVFALLMEQVGKAFGSLVGGLLEGITSVLPKVGENLAEFAKNSKPFFTILSSVPLEPLGDFIVSFGKFALMMGASKVISFFTGGLKLEKTGTELTKFGKSASGFFNKVATYPDEGLKKAPKVFKALGGMNSLPKFGGLAQFFTGETRLDVIAKQLSLFAPSAYQFFAFVTNYPDAGLKKAPKVFKALNGMKNLPKFGGLAQFLSGSTRLDIIAYQLSLFAPAAMLFFVCVTKYPEAGLEKAPRVFKAIGGMKNLPVMGGLAQFISGETRLDLIGFQLAAFAVYGAIAFPIIANYPEEGLDNTVKVFDMIKNIVSSLPDMGGIKQLFTGTTRIDLIGRQLAKFAPFAKTYFEQAEKFTDKGIDHGKRALEAIAGVGSIDVKSGGLLQAFSGSLDLEEIGEQLTDFAEESSDFFSAMKSLDVSDIDKGRQVIEALGGLGNSAFKSGGLLQVMVGGTDLSIVGEGLSEFATSSKTFFTNTAELKEKGFDNAKLLFSSLDGVKNLATVAKSIPKGTELTNLGTDLTNFYTNSKGFLNGTGKFKNLNKVSKVTELLSSMFGELTEFDDSKLTSISDGMIKLGDSATKLQSTLKTVKTGVSDETSAITKILSDFVTSSDKTLKGLSSKGTNVGTDLMKAIAQSIKNSKGVVQEALQNAVNSLKITVSSVATEQKKTEKKAVGLSTGGYVKTTGIAVLHPNEVVVNDDTTQKLQKFLKDNDDNGKRAVVNNIYPTSISSVPLLVDESNTGAKNNPSSNIQVTGGETVQDNKIVFEKGSIVVQCNSTKDEDIEKLADTLEKIINRKREKQQMAKRNTRK